MPTRNPRHSQFPAIFINKSAIDDLATRYCLAGRVYPSLPAARYGLRVNKPKVNPSYVLVRRAGDAIEVAEYRRFDDGSVLVIAEGLESTADDDPNAWREAWDDLESRGYVELRAAKAAGIVPEDWEPPVL